MNPAPFTVRPWNGFSSLIPETTLHSAASHCRWSRQRSTITEALRFAKRGAPPGSAFVPLLIAHSGLF